MQYITEREFLQTIVEIAQLHGWICHHVLDTRIHAKRIGPGYPDLTLVHPVRKQIIFAELKRERAKPTPEQQKWLDALRVCETETVVKVYLWRPSDMDKIERILAGEES